MIKANSAVVRAVLAALLLGGGALGHAEGRIYVTNEHDGTLSIIDATTYEVLDTTPVGEQPRGVGLSPDGKELYIALGRGDAIAVVDPSSGKVIRHLDGGEDPENFQVHANGDLYIANEEDAQASVLRPQSGEVIAVVEVGLEPEGVAISPDGELVIITSESTNMLHVIRTQDHELIENVLVGSRPRSATFSADGRYAYATAEIGSEIVRVDLESFEIDRRAKLKNPNSKPKDILEHAESGRLFVAGGRSNSIYVLDADTLQVLDEIPVGRRVWGLGFDKARERLFTTDGGSDTVSVIDVKSNKVLTTIKVGGGPWGVVVDA
ncbi:MAG: PQQ-dependent catabolism-associated beta-propeller protein [Pseudomonadota bacterium]